MSEELNNLLIKAYHHYKDDQEPLLPIKLIREYLELEGVSLEEYGPQKIIKED